MLYLINNRVAIKSYGKNLLAGLELAEPIYYEAENLDGSIEYQFVSNLINVLDSVFVQQDKALCTEDQRQFFEEYVLLADTDILSNEKFKQFDAWLAKWYGSNNLNYMQKEIYVDKVLEIDNV